MSAELSPRAAWAVAWRHARRLMGRHADEVALLDEAERELGRRLPLRWQGVGTACWIDRKARDELGAIHDRCFWRAWDRFGWGSGSLS